MYVFSVLMDKKKGFIGEKINRRVGPAERGMG